VLTNLWASTIKDDRGSHRGDVTNAVVWLSQFGPKYSASLCESASLEVKDGRSAKASAIVSFLVCLPHTSQVELCDE